MLAIYLFGLNIVDVNICRFPHHAVVLGIIFTCVMFWLTITLMVMMSCFLSAKFSLFIIKKNYQRCRIKFNPNRTSKQIVTVSKCTLSMFIHHMYHTSSFYDIISFYFCLYKLETVVYFVSIILCNLLIQLVLCSKLYRNITVQLLLVNILIPVL